MFHLTIEDNQGTVADEYSFEEGDFLIGRSQNADIILPSDNVSREHARLYTSEGHCYIEDRKSANGIFINGRRIHEVTDVGASAQLKVGDYYLHVRTDQPAAEEEVVHCRLHGRNLAVADQVFRITRSVNLLGRGKDCTITIIDPSISRVHSKLTVEDSGELVVQDMGSSNGTFIDDEQLQGPTQLDHGEILRLGNVEFTVEFPDRTEAGEPIDPTGPGPAEAGGSGGGLRILVAAAAAVIVLGGGILTLFATGMLGGGGSDGARTAAKADAGAKQDAQDGKQKLKKLVDRGRERMANAEWSKAAELWQKVLDEDPLHSEAQKELNRAKTAAEDKENLQKAKELRKEEKYGDASELLRDIEKGSPYHKAAKRTLGKLRKQKGELVSSAEEAVDGRECEKALKLYKQAKKIDPSDDEVLEAIEETKEKAEQGCR